MRNYSVYYKKDTCRKKNCTLKLEEKMKIKEPSDLFRGISKN